MNLVEGVHHVTFLTEDVESLSAFYGRVFDAKRTLDMTVIWHKPGVPNSQTLSRARGETVELS